MDPGIALKLFEDGATLFFLDVPLGSEFGIDFNSWRTGEKFKGVKMIPPGLHFIYYSAVSKEGTIAPRTGFFHNFKKKETMIRRWHAVEEDMKDSVSEEEKQRFSANLKNFDQFLGPYPYDSWKKWISHSNRLTVKIVGKIEPVEKKILSVADLVPNEVEQDHATGATPSKRVLRINREDDMLPSMHARPGTALNFTSIPENSFPEGSSASEITRYSLDSSYTLERMLSQWDNPDELLGELQMAFLCFVIGQTYSAFEQWKKLVHILCSADESLVKNPTFFLDFIGDLYFQMQEIPADFFVDIVSQNNFLTQSLQVLFGNVLGNDHLINKQLKRRCLQLKQYVTERFQWDFDAELDDEAPVIVSDVL